MYKIELIQIDNRQFVSGFEYVINELSFNDKKVHIVNGLYFTSFPFNNGLMDDSNSYNYELIQDEIVECKYKKSDSFFSILSNLETVNDKRKICYQFLKYKITDSGFDFNQPLIPYKSNNYSCDEIRAIMLQYIGDDELKYAKLSRLYKDAKNYIRGLFHD